jgi:NAD(P)-dependent dehydrogenase (short-subunit alcohol dehydrogenase family)
MRRGRLKDRVAIITGGARGIGRAIAFKMVKEGASVMLLDLLADELAQVIDELKALGGNAYSIPSDVSDRSAVDDVVSRTLKKLGTVDILVNNAGISLADSLEEIKEEDWDTLVKINLKGSFFCVQSVTPIMKDNGYGKIVNISSRASLGKLGRTVYGATKAGLIGMTRSMALELAKYGVNVNCVAPGPIATELFNSVNPEGSEKTKAIIDAIPLKRIGRPEDVANLVAFLASDEASFITGQTLFICGGLTVGMAH